MNIGTGSHTYEWIDWSAKLPSGMSLGRTHGVVVDAADNLYIFNQSKDALITLDRDGKFIRSWGEQYAKGAHGLYLSNFGGKETLWLVDQELKSVEQYSLDGKKLMELKKPDRPDIYAEGVVYKPTDVCVAPNGDIYLCDGYGASWIHQHDRNGKYIRSIGGKGSEAGQLSCPHGAWVDTRRATPELYVADRGNNRIQVFSLDGKHLRFITAEMKRPCCFYQWRDELYIPDLEARVTIYDKNDKPVAVLGDAPEMPKTEGWPNIPQHLKVGKFSSPHACCVDSKGDVYVGEWITTGRLTKLNRLRG
jgi:DNA-binding beta-propeller fold protein YncE